MKRRKLLGIGLAAVMMIGAAQAASLYWDPNGATPDFGSGGTWGTDAFWTADDTGAFSDGGSATTTAGDNVQVNSDADGSFEMGVSGDVHAYNIVGIPTVFTTTINGPGTIHLYASGGDLADALFSGGNDLRETVDPNLVLEATVGSSVYLANQGGNNSIITLNGSITSTNTIDLIYADIGTATITDASSSMDLQGGSFIVDQGNSFRIKNVNVLGVIGSGVTNVTMTSPLGGHGSDPRQRRQRLHGQHDAR
ncbi:MAG: hypothetical protein O3A87_01090 [Verrucomicrobia bacterium]|nr:hypothetical protein [Verrucomicrobiota bacterium]